MSAAKLLVFSGSTRQGSYNTKLATAVATMAGDLGADVTLVSLADYEAPLFHQDWERENGVPQTVTDLGALMAESDAAFIASPEYNAGVTPLVKNTIDWLSRLKPHPIKETVFSLGAASPGMLGGIRGLFSLRTTLVGLNAIVMPEQLTVGGATSAFNEDGSFANERTVSLANVQLERLIDVARKLRAR
jgi:chromate reductase